MFFICNLTRISCRMLICCSCLLIKIIKYVQGKNSTKFYFYRGARNSLPCIGSTPLKVTRLDSLFLLHLFPCLAFHVHYIAYHFGACLHSLANCFIALKYAPCCKQHVCITCFAYIFLTVTPFGVIFVWNLIRISCTLCWCYFFAIFNQPKIVFRSDQYQIL